MADWSLPAETDTTRRSSPSNTLPTTAFTYLSSADYDDDASFSVVDRATTINSRFNRPPTSTATRGAFSGGRGGLRSTTGRTTAQSGAWGAARSNTSNSATTRSNVPGSNSRLQSTSAASTGARRGGGRFADRQAKIREPSVKVDPNWDVVEELDFARISKLYYQCDPPVDIAVYGSVQYIDKAYERISSKNEKPLLVTKKTHHNVTAFDDPVLQNLAKSADGYTIITTSSVLAALMASTRSINSFDIIVTKKKNIVYLDKRDGGVLDLPTVNENASDAPMDGPDKATNINSPLALAHEAGDIVRSYSQQVLREAERVTFTNPSPFSHGEPAEALVSAAYRYRQWQLGEMKLIARTQIDAAVHQPGAGLDTEPPSGVAFSSASESDTLYATIRSLNEFDPRAPGAGGAPSWRQKLDSQRGAVVATELKNNANKLCRWTIESLLASADQIRLGFVSRSNPRDRKRHGILGSMVYKPDDLATHIHLNVGAGWGLVKAFGDLCEGLDDGKYLLMRDPNKPVLKLYKVLSAAAIAAKLAAEAASSGVEDQQQADEDAY
ncbi:hypothetical protein RTP6_002964 [Batrachochytrium dendrobatidis]